MWIEHSLEILKALGETLTMVLAASLIATLVGLPLGIGLFSSRHPHLWAQPRFNYLLNTLINATRSIPFIILMVICIPLTRWMIGTSIGTMATIVPLSIAAIPFMARLIDHALSEVPAGLIEVGLSMGATSHQIIRRILLVEARPSIVHSISMTIINLITYSAMAGVIGGGGLGDLAIRYGYQRFDIKTLFVATLILILLVQVTQHMSDWVVRRYKYPQKST